MTAHARLIPGLSWLARVVVVAVVLAPARVSAQASDSAAPPTSRHDWRDFGFGASTSLLAHELRHLVGSGPWRCCFSLFGFAPVIRRS